MLNAIALAEALRTIVSPSLKGLRFNFLHYGPYNEDFLIFPVGSPKERDHLSLALNKLSRQLEWFKISETSVLSPELFWPLEGPKPYWPFMKKIWITFSPVTPDGEWRYNRHSEPANRPKNFEVTKDMSDSEESHYSSDDPELFLELDPVWEQAKQFAVQTGRYPVKRFRRVPIQENFDSMFLSAAKAAGQMPNLQLMDIISPLARSPYSYNRMIFVERGASIEGPDLIEWDHDDKFDFDGLGNKPIVYWLKKWWDSSEVDKAWVESKGERGDLEFRRIFRPHRLFTERQGGREPLGSTDT